MWGVSFEPSVSSHALYIGLWARNLNLFHILGIEGHDQEVCDHNDSLTRKTLYACSGAGRVFQCGFATGIYLPVWPASFIEFDSVLHLELHSRELF